jgi:zinc protease
MSLVIKQGAEAAAPGKSGLAALTARMLTESTRHRNPFQLAEAAENFGSTLQSDTQRDLLEVSFESLPSDTERAIELLAEVVREPAFSSQDFERVRSQWLDDLLAERQSPVALAALVGIRALYGTTRGAPVNGGVSDVKNLTLSDLKAWHSQHVVPSNAALVAVGPIEADALFKVARNAFGNWRTVQPLQSSAQYSASPRSSSSVIVVNRKDAVQSALFLAQPFPRRIESGHEARQLLNDVFGGLFTSRINMNLREAHAYTYGAHSSVIANRNFGVFIVQTSVRTDVTANSIKELIGELTAISSPTTSHPLADEELIRARADLTHRLGARLEQNGYLANDLATIFAQGLANDYFATLPLTYAQLNIAEVTKQALLIEPDKFTTVIVGDREKIEPGLVQAGFKISAPESDWLD